MKKIFQNILRFLNVEVTINGNNVSEIKGNNIKIKNGRIYVGDKDITPDEKVINITITGNVYEMSVDTCNTINITGDVQNLTTSSGDVSCNQVYGEINTKSGDVQCTEVLTNVKSSSGDINVNGNVQGNCQSSSGDIEVEGNIYGDCTTNSGDIEGRGIVKKQKE